MIELPFFEFAYGWFLIQSFELILLEEKTNCQKSPRRKHRR